MEDVYREKRDIEKGIKMAFRFAFGVSHNPPIPPLSRCFCALVAAIYYISLPRPHPRVLVPFHLFGLARSRDVSLASTPAWRRVGDALQVSTRYRCC